ELRNISGASVNLFDPANPSNTWKFTDGVDFTFPTSSSLPAGGFALIVPIDPTLFRSTYRVAAGIQVFGPYVGSLDNSGEKLEISKPGAPNGATIPFIVDDHVTYSDMAPWPTTPDGTGPSLARSPSSVYGNDPIDWIAATATPGYDNAAVNAAPMVNAGSDQSLASQVTTTTLAGSVSDDGLPYGNPLTI